MELIVTHLIPDPEPDSHKAEETDGQSKQVDDRQSLVSDQIPECRFKKVREHDDCVSPFAVCCSLMRVCEYEKCNGCAMSVSY